MWIHLNIGGASDACVQVFHPLSFDGTVIRGLLTFADASLPGHLWLNMAEFMSNAESRCLHKDDCMFDSKCVGKQFAIRLVKFSSRRLTRYCQRKIPALINSSNQL